MIRVAMGVDGIGGFAEDAQGNQNRAKILIDAGINAGLYVIIDFHSHHAESFQSQAITFFEEIAREYGHTNNLIYEIYNEPLAVSWSDVVKPYAEAVTAAIRKIDPNNLIVVGTPNWAQDVDIAAADPIQDKNIAYSLHFYASSPHHQDHLRQKALKALSQNVALFVTEWGTCQHTGDGAIDPQLVKKWLDFMQKHQLSHCNWAVSDKLEAASILRPGACRQGGWSPQDLTPSGVMVKKIIRTYHVSVRPSHIVRFGIQ